MVQEGRGLEAEGGTGGEQDGDGEETALRAGAHGEIADEQRLAQRQCEGLLTAPQLQHLRGARVLQQHQRPTLLLLQQYLHHFTRHVQ